MEGFEPRLEKVKWRESRRIRRKEEFESLRWRAIEVIWRKGRGGREDRGND